LVDVQYVAVILDAHLTALEVDHRPDHSVEIGESPVDTDRAPHASRHPFDRDHDHLRICGRCGGQVHEEE